MAHEQGSGPRPGRPGGICGTAGFGNPAGLGALQRLAAPVFYIPLFGVCWGARPEGTAGILQKIQEWGRAGPAFRRPATSGHVGLGTDTLFSGPLPSASVCLF